MSVRFISRLALAALGMSSAIAMASSIELSAPAVRATPPGAPTSGGYVTLINHSDQERFLVAAESNVANKVEIHLSEMQGDTMKMYQVDQVVIPAHGDAQLKPGGYHIMFMGLKQPLKAGDSVALTLVMKNGERIKLSAPVLSPDEMAAYAPGSMSMHHMNHGDMDHSKMNHDKMDHQGHGDMADKKHH
ncbi:copper chaperone PCu(A)C [Rhodanobacter aciditrophus]|uniref:Copper chaperone PCu(A)C n=1 Tax=Rhodanobacter aciditrophus TaxID=1623218 RepID=A0ABW4AZV4_9GAMM